MMLVYNIILHYNLTNNTITYYISLAVALLITTSRDTSRVLRHLYYVIKCNELHNRMLYITQFIRKFINILIYM